MNYKILNEFPEYAICAEGRVISLKYKKERTLKESTSKEGYKRVLIQDQNGNAKCRSVHRLVALAFIPNPDNLPEVNHKDNDKSNNHVENLEWVTKSQNVKHMHDHHFSKLMKKISDRTNG